jgi:hypothetical protein
MVAAGSRVRGMVKTRAKVKVKVKVRMKAKVRAGQRHFGHSSWCLLIGFCRHKPKEQSQENHYQLPPLAVLNEACVFTKIRTGHILCPVRILRTSINHNVNNFLKDWLIRS